MPDYFDQLWARYRTRGLLVDTNLLVLLVVGLLDTRRITSFKRTNAFAVEDFELLKRVVDYFETVVTTPHILTETSNLVGQLSGKQASNGRSVIARLVANLMNEEYCPAARLTAQSSFQHFGLADTGIDEVASGTYLILTDDLPLYHYLGGRGQDAINFNHLREANW